MRFRDFLRVAVLLFGGAATALAVVSVVSATREDTNTLVYVAAGWWVAAAVAAIEGRDGVEFWFDRSSPFGPPKLLRLPGMRKIEPPAYAGERDEQPAPL